MYPPQFCQAKFNDEPHCSNENHQNTYLIYNEPEIYFHQYYELSEDPYYDENYTEKTPKVLENTNFKLTYDNLIEFHVSIVEKELPYIKISDLPLKPLINTSCTK